MATRIAKNVIPFASAGTYYWTCPAGITEVYMGTEDSASPTTKYIPLVPVQVVPNTTYTIAISATTQTIDSPNFFGGNFKWTGGDQLVISWIE